MSWRTEQLEGNNIKYCYKVRKVLDSARSAFQKVEIIDNPHLGKMLFNDDFVMISEKDEFIYHDMIAHVPLFTHPKPSSVLIIGGGDGGTAREVLRHPSVKHCELVEIDQLVVDLCKKHIPLTADSFKNPKLDIFIEDGVQFVARTKKKYDIILIDSSDPIGPAQPLFGKEFYQNIYNILKNDGLIVAQAEAPLEMFEMQKKLFSIISSQFPIARIYNYFNMTYPCGAWSFCMGSKKYHPIEDFKPQRVEDSKMEFSYYNEKIHTASFCLPTFQKKKLQKIAENKTC